MTCQKNHYILLNLNILLVQNRTQLDSKNVMIAIKAGAQMAKEKFKGIHFLLATTKDLSRQFLAPTENHKHK